MQSFYAPAVPELEAPLPLLPTEGAELDPRGPRMISIVWSPVAGAASYTVEVNFCEARHAVEKGCVGPGPLEGRDWGPQAGIEGTTYTFRFIGAQPHRWRVWAVDSSGRPGAKSAWAIFTFGW